jgi:hypothetical protein
LLGQILLVDLLSSHGWENFSPYLFEKGWIVYEMRDKPKGKLVQVPYQADTDLAHIDQRSRRTHAQ